MGCLWVVQTFGEGFEGGLSSGPSTRNRIAESNLEDFQERLRIQKFEGNKISQWNI